MIYMKWCNLFGKWLKVISLTRSLCFFRYCFCFLFVFCFKFASHSKWNQFVPFNFIRTKNKLHLLIEIISQCCFSLFFLIWQIKAILWIFGWYKPANMPKDYDYLLKVLLVGDSDVGKHEIMAGLEDASSESPFCSRSGNCKWIFLWCGLCCFECDFSNLSSNHLFTGQRIKLPQSCWTANVCGYVSGTHQVKSIGFFVRVVFFC